MPQAWATKGIQFICFLLFTLIFLMTTTGLLGSLCFFISSDYNARTFLFCQQIFSAIAVAAAAGSFLESAHLCVLQNPRVGSVLRCLLWAVGSSFDHLPLQRAVRFPGSPSNLPPSDMVTGPDLTDHTLLLTSLHAICYPFIHFKNVY